MLWIVFAKISYCHVILLFLKHKIYLKAISVIRTGESGQKALMLVLTLYH